MQRVRFMKEKWLTMRDKGLGLRFTQEGIFIMGAL